MGRGRRPVRVRPKPRQASRVRLPRVALDRLAVKRQLPLQDIVLVRDRLHALARRAAHGLRLLRRQPQGAVQRRGERLDVAPRRDEAGAAVLDHLHHAAAVGGDDQPSGGHGLEADVGVVVPGRGHGHDRGARIEGEEFLARPEVLEEHVAGVLARDELEQAFLEAPAGGRVDRVAPDKAQAQAGMVLLQAGERRDQHLAALAAFQAAGEQNIVPGGSGLVRARRRRGKGIGIDGDAAGRQAQFFPDLARVEMAGRGQPVGQRGAAVLVVEAVHVVARPGIPAVGAHAVLLQPVQPDHGRDVRDVRKIQALVEIGVAGRLDVLELQEVEPGLADQGGQEPCDVPLEHADVAALLDHFLDERRVGGPHGPALLVDEAHPVNPESFPLLRAFGRGFGALGQDVHVVSARGQQGRRELDVRAHPAAGDRRILRCYQADIHDPEPRGLHGFAECEIRVPKSIPHPGAQARTGPPQGSVHCQSVN